MAPPSHKTPPGCACCGTNTGARETEDDAEPTAPPPIPLEDDAEQKAREAEQARQAAEKQEKEKTEKRRLWQRKEKDLTDKATSAEQAQANAEKERKAAEERAAAAEKEKGEMERKLKDLEEQNKRLKEANDQAVEEDGAEEANDGKKKKRGLFGRNKAKAGEKEKKSDSPAKEPPASPAKEPKEEPAPVPASPSKGADAVSVQPEPVADDKNYRLNKFYVSSALKDLFEAQDMAFLKGDWLAARSTRTRRPLPMRQDLESEPAVYWAPDTVLLDRTGQLRAKQSQMSIQVIATSYRWYRSDHPDPDGQQMQLLGGVLQKFLNQQKTAEAAVFIDWASVFQAKGGKRKMAHDDSYRRAMEQMGLLYSHARVLVWCIRGLQPGAHSPRDCTPFHQRGWTTFETRCSALLHDRYSVLDICRVNLDAAGFSSWDEEAQLKPEPPILPEAFERLLANRAFSNASDAPKLIRIYRTAFEDLMCQAEKLDYSHRDWGDLQAQELAKVLPRCVNLKQLNLHYNDIGDDGAMHLGRAFRNCPGLVNVTLQGNRMSDQSAADLELIWKQKGKDHTLVVIYGQRDDSFDSD